MRSPIGSFSLGGLMALARDVFTSLLGRRPFDAREIAAVRNEIDFGRVIEDHIAWRNQLVHAVRVSPAAIAALGRIGDDTDCEVGRWLHGAGKAHYGYLGAFHDLIDLHREFHRLAVLVADLAASGRSGDAERLMDSGLRPVSTELVARLNRFRVIFDR